MNQQELASVLARFNTSPEVTGFEEAICFVREPGEEAMHLLEKFYEHRPV